MHPQEVSKMEEKEGGRTSERRDDCKSSAVALHLIVSNLRGAKSGEEDFFLSWSSCAYKRNEESSD